MVSFSLCLDRFEGGIAVLLSGSQEILVPRHLLPPDVSEGDHLIITFEKDDGSRDRARSEIEDLQKRLSKGDER